VVTTVAYLGEALDITRVAEVTAVVASVEDEVVAAKNSELEEVVSMEVEGVEGIAVSLKMEEVSFLVTDLKAGATLVGMAELEWVKRMGSHKCMHAL
ncbi:hypothetical protein BIW11_12808, partial [Tropilaelaps mercedesae]